MPKHKKTRKQKQLSDMRHQEDFPRYSYSLQQHVTAEVKHEHVTPVKHTTAQRVTTQGYEYLFTDLMKTTILTASIILVEIFIKQFYL